MKQIEYKSLISYNEKHPIVKHTIFAVMVSLLVYSIAIAQPAYADTISCSTSQTIQWNEELQKYECIISLPEPTFPISLNGKCVKNCDISESNTYKKSKETKPFNLSGFAFGAPDARKNPTWVGWIPASEYNVVLEKSALEQKMSSDRITMHGIDRDHYNWSSYMMVQVDKAISTMEQMYYIDDYLNPDFEDKENYYTIYLGGKSRSEDPLLQANIISEMGRTLQYSVDYFGNFTNRYFAMD